MLMMLSNPYGEEIDYQRMRTELGTNRMYPR
jgi:hypothetical protein